MPKITFVEQDGTAHTLDAEPGTSLMQLAVRNGLPSIIGECGGNCICSTCHLHVDAEWSQTVGPAGEEEEMTLEFAEARVATSRLGCQITVTDELDGLVVHLPESQS
ncbi:2Fe-2S iron-sulfur cluster-binding protein [Streptomyces cavernicola]|uniref:2Fe-2S iron-sulfur cluster-binding protein n=1 Tax=Streptomyces cavernicola TaxID=3043613 RepID=A0ABT6S5C6_9ACTN|nr:2Fe-2S iron-sulfur cluster-binding protein [Streptomyces sp. B-S-A6]MDI3403289.1 2Fe-2S iron-sulfur cluster-binding protein [Streptomyces sp. B-S-A6]